MLTPACHRAEQQAAALGAAAAILHETCPGSYIEAETGEIRDCACGCHSTEVRVIDEADVISYGPVRGGPLPVFDEKDAARTRPAQRPAQEGPLPVLSASQAAKGAQAGTQGRKRAAKTPPGGGKCECGCGADVRRRFLPGHDAILKSHLLKEAKSGGPDNKLRAGRELDRRGWRKFLREEEA